MDIIPLNWNHGTMYGYKEIADVWLWAWDCSWKRLFSHYKRGFFLMHMYSVFSTSSLGETETI